MAEKEKPEAEGGNHADEEPKARGKEVCVAEQKEMRSRKTVAWR